MAAPYFSSAILAATALLESGDEAACRELLSGIADGSTVATLAWVEKLGAWDNAAQTDARATATSDGWSLTGHKTLVLDGATASLVLVVAGAPVGPSLFAGCPRLGRDDVPAAKDTALHESVRQHRVGRHARAAGAILERTLRAATVALAAERIGTAERCLEINVDYSKLRIQYGRPIGSVQALKHRVVDLLSEIETAKSASTPRRETRGCRSWRPWPGPMPPMRWSMPRAR